MKVCIGITTFNRVDVLKTAIQSALAQDYPDKEVFVVDDASTDRTPDLRREFPQVRWHRYATSHGYRAARNHMMTETDADLFCSLDDDSWFTSSDGLRLGVELFEQNEKLGAVGFEILDEAHPDGHAETRVRPSNMFIGCGHLLRLNAARNVGLYHEMPGEYGGEEKDLSVRLLDAEWDVVRYQGVHVWHDKTFQTRNIGQQHSSGVANDLAFAFFRAPLWMVVWLIPCKILNHLRFAGEFACRNVAAMSDFDREIRTRYGRTVFLGPAVSGIRSFLWNSLPSLRQRSPVRTRAFQEFIRRGHSTASS